MRQRFQSRRVESFTESVIREMTRRALQVGAVNLAQGFPDFAAPAFLKQAAARAIDGDFNQYAITWGAKPFRDAIAASYRRFYGLELDPEREITVCCGATEGMIASLLAVVNPDEEVIVFEPFYENYAPDTYLCGAQRRLVALHPPDWSFDPDELRRAFTARTKAIIVNTPNNPTGKVFTADELRFIGELCREHDALLITDEIYEHILYDGAAHTPAMAIEGLRDRAVLVNSMSKTYSVTGWRVGWVLASPDITDSIRKVHDFLTVGAAAPLQHAGVTALTQPDTYYRELACEYQQRRNLLVGLLEEAGFRCFLPRGAYYVMADIAGFQLGDDRQFVQRLLERASVAAVPGSSFYDSASAGNRMIRFCFCKKYETLEEAGQRLKRMR